MSKENALLEIYKLHVDIAERAAASREEFTKLYTGVVSTIVAAGVLLHRLKPEGGTELSWVLPALGAVVSLTWLLSFLSVTARLVAKHKILAELEQDMPFAFLSREGEAFKPRMLRRKITGSLMPTLFLAICVVWWCNGFPK